MVKKTKMLHFSPFCNIKNDSVTYFITPNRFIYEIRGSILDFFFY